MSNELLLHSKLSKHLKTKHPHLQDKSTNYFKRLSEQQTKAANSSINKITVSEKAQIASYQVSQLIAQNMKAHTIGEPLILPACKKVVATILGNETAKEINKDSTVQRYS
ncbi:zinc finger BED domain-containing protein 5-like [Octopus sinensis]|uniref:Zinc finger BED domain-containing protein 5-like n=1 Tax=Octopus sinensis TaxID=2607531 RepID=A0A6P7SW51_9MOLL|nr:zinc finger BED domain-containing protein 5-like [Octopus sinensis]